MAQHPPPAPAPLLRAAARFAAGGAVSAGASTLALRLPPATRGRSAAPSPAPAAGRFTSLTHRGVGAAAPAACSASADAAAGDAGGAAAELGGTAAATSSAASLPLAMKKRGLTAADSGSGLGAARCVAAPAPARCRRSGCHPLQTPPLLQHPAGSARRACVPAHPTSGWPAAATEGAKQVSDGEAAATASGSRRQSAAHLLPLLLGQLL